MKMQEDNILLLEFEPYYRFGENYIYLTKSLSEVMEDLECLPVLNLLTETKMTVAWLLYERQFINRI